MEYEEKTKRTAGGQVGTAGKLLFKRQQFSSDTKSRSIFSARTLVRLSTLRIQSSRKHHLPEMHEEDDNDGDAGSMRGIVGPVRNKSDGSTALINAVSIQATAKTESQGCKYDILSEQMQQQGQLCHRELDLEQEWFKLEREKAALEERKTTSMIRQLEASIRIGIS